MDINEEIDLNEAKQYLKNNGNKLIQEDLQAIVSLQSINKIYPNGVKAVYDFNLDINERDFVALVGPSGCGKSTTLRMIAGLEEISSGSLFINKVYSNYVPSKDRDIAMVFQSYALYPNKNVYNNIAFGLQIRHIDKNEIKRRVFEAADILDLGHYLDRYPRELSGGQMQRVALGRAIVRQSKLFLMDEPLSNLDAKLRVQMRSEIVRIHKEVGATTIYVTHDQVEAMTMANTIVVMNRGFIQQIGKPIDVYHHPENLFVATFIGSPSMNILKVRYDHNKIILNDSYEIDLEDGFKKVYQDFYLKRCEELKKILDNFNEFGEEEVLKMNSHQIYVKVDKPLQYKKKKFNILNLFKNKKLEEQAKIVRREEIYNQIKNMYDNAQSALSEPHDILIGIRPENFALDSKFDGAIKSRPIDMSVDLVELLGYEYIIHGKLNDCDLQIKVKEISDIENLKTLKVAFDIEKMHIFDIDSGLTIK